MSHDGAYGGVCRGTTESQLEWNRDYQELDGQWKGAELFSKRYNARLISVESIGLYIHSTGLSGVRPIWPSRLEWVEAMLQKQHELECSWFYWAYAKNAGYPENPDEGSTQYYGPAGSDTPVAELITKYANMK